MIKETRRWSDFDQDQHEALRDKTALFNPETSVLIQQHPFYKGNLKSETPGDSKNTVLHWGDVLAESPPHSAADAARRRQACFWGALPAKSAPAPLAEASAL